MTRSNDAAFYAEELLAARWRGTERRQTTVIFQHSTGLLYSQLLALIVGGALIARHRRA
jgi:hypothetical protein